MKRTLLPGILLLVSLVLIGGYLTVQTHARAHPGTLATTAAPSKNTPATAAPTVAAPVAKTVIVNADIEKRYDDVSQLVHSKYLSAIVRGTVLSTRYIDFNTVQYTICTVRVIKSWTSEVKQGDVIKVVDDGGVTTVANMKRDAGAGDLSDPNNAKRDPQNPTNNAISAADEHTNVAVLFEGEPLAKTGDEAVYFLGRGELAIAPGIYYEAVGAYQGKFLVSHGIARRHTPRGEGPASAQMDISALETQIDAALR